MRTLLVLAALVYLILSTDWRGCMQNLRDARRIFREALEIRRRRKILEKEHREIERQLRERSP